ncbi:MAG: tetratricopeptide repeat protein [Patescibacteria group bacterium]|nr:tetratricopeptide repeat protein [Patescibacteria group bacterium]
MQQFDKKNSSKILSSIIIYLIKALALILPLFFLPLTVEWFEFNKQYLLWLAVPLIVLLWLIKMIIDKEIKFRQTPLDIPIVLFLALACLSSVFSLDRFSSFFGFYGRFSDAWLGLLSLVLFYFILTNFSAAKGKLNVFNIIKLMLLSYSVVIITALLTIFGWLRELIALLAWIFPRAIGQAEFNVITFNTAGGSLEGLSIFSAAVIFLLIGLLIFNNKRSRWPRVSHQRHSLPSKTANNVKGEIPLTSRWPRVFHPRHNLPSSWFFSIILILSILFLVIINFYIAWWCLFAGAVLYFILALISAKRGNLGLALKNLTWPAILIIISLTFLIFPEINSGSFFIGKKLPQEIRLDYKTALSVVKQSVKDKPLLGKGPGTFSYDFSLYRDSDFNQSIFWQYRFDKAPSHILEMAAGLGSLGILSYFLILSVFFYLVFIFSKKFLLHYSKDNGLIISLLIAFVVLFLAQFVYLINTILLFLFWTCMALIMVLLRDTDKTIFKERIIKLDKHKSSSKLIYLLLVAIAAGWLFLTALEIKYWAADVIYAKAANQEANLIKAARLNPNRYNYEISLAKLYLNQVRAEFAKPAGERDSRLMHIKIDNSINWARQAVKTSVNSVVAHETLGMIYRDVRLLTVGSEAWAARSFEQAGKLEPGNPVLLTELAKAYLNNGMIAEAKKSFSQALNLKNDYYDAKFGLAKVYVKEKNEKDAIIILEELTDLAVDAEVFYELGRLYYNQGEIEHAVERFLQVLDISSNHSNALYSLALAYQLQGDNAQALIYFEKVLQLNPENKEVIKRVEEIMNDE